MSLEDNDIDNLISMHADADAELKSRIIDIINGRHMRAFGPVDKSFRLKILDLQTQKIVDRVSHISEKYHLTVLTCKMLDSYWTEKPYALEEIGGLKYLEIIRDKITPSLFKLQEIGAMRQEIDINSAVMQLIVHIYQHRAQQHMQGQHTQQHMQGQQTQQHMQGQQTQQHMQGRQTQQHMQGRQTQQHMQGQQTQQHMQGQQTQQQQRYLTRRDITIVYPDISLDQLRIRTPMNNISDYIEPEPYDSRVSIPSFLKFLATNFHTYMEVVPDIDFVSDLHSRGLINDEEADHLLLLTANLVYSIRTKLTPKIMQPRDGLAPRCRFYNIDSDLSERQRQMLPHINAMEAFCTKMAITPVSIEHIGPYIALHIPLITMPETITGFRVTMRYVSKIIRHYDRSQVTRVTVTIQDQMGVDHGGVTRMLLNRLAIILKSYLPEIGGRYYIPANTNADVSSRYDILYISLFIWLVVLTGTHVDLPLTYGTMYAITHDIRHYTSNLHELMALYRLADPDDFQLLINMVTMDDREIREYLPDYPQSSQVPEGAPIDEEHKLAWLYVVLLKKVFYPGGDKGELTALQELSDHKIIKGSPLSIDQYFRPNLNHETMEGLNIIVTPPHHAANWLQGWIV